MTTTSAQKQVEIYAIFCKLNSVNTIQGKFEGEIDIVSSWFDTLHGDYNPDRHWNPQLECENLIDSDKKIRTRVEVKACNETNPHYMRIIQYQKITGTFSEWLRVKEFPFDVQKLGNEAEADSCELTEFSRCDHLEFTSYLTYQVHRQARILLSRSEGRA